LFANISGICFNTESMLALLSSNDTAIPAGNGCLTKQYVSQSNCPYGKK
jgi:hypothetical protein